MPVDGRFICVDGRLIGSFAQVITILPNGRIDGRSDITVTISAPGEASVSRLFGVTVRLHPTPYTLHPTSYTLHPIPYTLHPTPYTLHPTPYTQQPTVQQLK